VKFTSDPRCPVHRNYEVYLQWPQFMRGPAVWVCSICRRPLGAATVHGANGFQLRWPPGRMPSIEDRVIRMWDWQWSPPGSESDSEIGETE
jgi:hypothetical protein